MTESRTSGPTESPWHAIEPEQALVRLDTGPGGLSASEANRRLLQYGPNSLPAARPPGAFARFLSQFNNVLIYVLLASAVITGVLSHIVDTIVILAVVIANAAVGFVQEGRAHRALDAVRKMVTLRASALRNGHRIAIAAEQLVPGDVVVLEAGDRVPADLRLLRARGLRVEEAILTGESVPVEKSLDAVAVDAALGDRSSVVFSGTFVAAGQGAGVVVATGTQTELGKISALLGTVEKLETPLLRQMNRFGRALTVVILGTALLVLVFALLVRGYPATAAFMAVVGLAVAAIPEGLPAVLTITLAAGVQRMAARNAIVRRLPAVETLGSVSIICSDKTGTLTRNEMSVRSVVTASSQYEVTGAGYEPRGAFRLEGRDIDAREHPILFEATRTALLCNDASLRQTSNGWLVEGDPMEGALLSFAVKAGHDPELVRKQFPRRDEIPFDARHRYMATLHHAHDDGTFTCVKGAPEQLLSMCGMQRGELGESALDAGRWLASIDTLAAQGMRVLALASGRLPDGKQDLAMSDVQSGLTFIGLLGLIDPPREEAIEAVRQCRAAGIGVKMITGDHAVTAAAIAAELGLAEKITVTTGRELDGLNESDFARTARESTVLARASPEHKLRLVEALQTDGSVVAMTGDGVNDAPALRRADIGVAMGSKGTEVAKESAEMVLADDNFATIVAAVREGRRVYDNLRKVVGWTLPTGGGEASTIIAAIVAGATLPVTPVQILWINLITAVALGLTLAFEPADPAIMNRPPRPADEALLSGALIWRTMLVSAIFAAAAFAMFERATSAGVSVQGARTIVVNTIVGMEIFFLYSVRYAHSRRRGWRAVLGTPAVLVGVTGVIVGQVAFTYLPFMQAAFDTRAISALDWFEITVAGFALLGILAITDRVQGALSRFLRRHTNRDVSRRESGAPGHGR